MVGDEVLVDAIENHLALLEAQPLASDKKVIDARGGTARIRKRVARHGIHTARPVSWPQQLVGLEGQ